MRQTRTEEILSAAYPARIELIEALRQAALGGQNDVARLRSAVEALLEASGRYGDAPAAAIYASVAELAMCVSLLLEWRGNVLSAAPDAQRFQTAARERAAAWANGQATDGAHDELMRVANQIVGAATIGEVASLAATLAGIPLPVGLYSQFNRHTARRPDDDRPPQARPPQLTVAFLKFTIDGKPLAETHFVSPGEMHDLDIEVRVSRWPVNATALVLEPVTIEHANAYQMPVFSIPAPAGTGPFQLNQQGRAALTVPQHLNARPFEFKYVARFVPTGSEQPVETVGQRTLLLEGLDLARQSLTGYRHVDQKLLDLRNELRVASGILQQELTDALGVVIPLANLAAQSVNDNYFDAALSEEEFQKCVRSFLRAYPNIGSTLEEHPRAAGGITDLSYRGIRLELKAEKSKRLTFADCEQFVPQAASYAIGSGKRIAVLCVLDGSPKTTTAFPIEDGIGAFVHRTSETPIYVLALLLQGNLARPSQFSRYKR